VRLFDELTNKNFDLYAAKHYQNHKCLCIEDFEDDISRFKYILRLLRKYKDTHEINIRLVLNHIIVVYNVFEIHAANRMMFFRIDDDLHGILKTFLIYLNYISEDQHKQITIDLSIGKQLQEI